MPLPRDLRKRQWHSTPVLLPGKSRGRRSLVGCSPWGCWESDTTERLHFHFSFSCIGEGNGNPLQCSCLENPRDGGVWWVAVYGVAQSRTRLKRLSSSSSSKRSESLRRCHCCGVWTGNSDPQVVGSDDSSTSLVLESSSPSVIIPWGKDLACTLSPGVVTVSFAMYQVLYARPCA